MCQPPDPCVTINGAMIKCVDKIIHLGHLFSEDLYDFKGELI